MSTPHSPSTWIWNGSAMVPGDSIPVTDRGFRYGMSLFESLRMTATGPRHLEAHLALLKASCQARQFPCPEGALEAAGALLEHWRPEGESEGFGRIYVTAGDGAPTAAATACRVFVFMEARARPTRDAFALSVAEDVFHPAFGGLKTGNYWFNLDALQRAQSVGCQEALLFNERAELVSACVANVFLVHGARIRTPATVCGARPGVLRAEVMARETVEECSLFFDDVLSADEIFLTNSWIGVRRVVSIRERVFFSREVSSRLAHL